MSYGTCGCHYLNKIIDILFFGRIEAFHIQTQKISSITFNYEVDFRENCTRVLVTVSRIE